ncbi:MAG: hypothetical protein QXT53_01510 [Ignisphaera sp.]
MNISYMLKYVQTLEKAYEDTLKKATSGKVDKRYLQVLSEVVSFITSVRTFLSKAIVMDKTFSNIKNGRICFKWFYYENGPIVSLSRIEPQISISYDGTSITASYHKNSISFSEREIKIKFNEFSDTILINDADNAITKRSIIMRLIGEVSTALLRYSDEFSVCAKASKLLSS